MGLKSTPGPDPDPELDPDPGPERSRVTMSRQLALMLLKSCQSFFRRRIHLKVSTYSRMIMCLKGCLSVCFCRSRKKNEKGERKKKRKSVETGKETKSQRKTSVLVCYSISPGYEVEHCVLALLSQDQMT